MLLLYELRKDGDIRTSAELYDLRAIVERPLEGKNHISMTKTDLESYWEIARDLEKLERGGASKRPATDDAGSAGQGGG